MQIEPNTFICGDGLDVMREILDKEFDLCLTDPPYGIGETAEKNNSRGTKFAPATKFTHYEWDKQAPCIDDFKLISKVSKNQIIWGGNYFVEALKNSSCWLVWDKDNSGDFADCELAWTNFKSAVRIFKWRWNGMLQQEMGNRKETRYHPTQKPVALFVWCLLNYSKPGDLIIDPFSGSGTTALACHKTGRKFLCIDKEQEYIDIAKKRYLELISQQDLFITDVYKPEIEQTDLFKL